MVAHRSAHPLTTPPHSDPAPPAAAGISGIRRASTRRYTQPRPSAHRPPQPPHRPTHPTIPPRSVNSMSATQPHPCPIATPPPLPPRTLYNRPPKPRTPAHLPPIPPPTASALPRPPPPRGEAPTGAGPPPRYTADPLGIQAHTPRTRATAPAARRVRICRRPSTHSCAAVTPHRARSAPATLTAPAWVAPLPCLPAWPDAHELSAHPHPSKKPGPPATPPPADRGYKATTRGAPRREGGWQPEELQPIVD